MGRARRFARGISGVAALTHPPGLTRRARETTDQIALCRFAGRDDRLRPGGRARPSDPETPPRPAGIAVQSQQGRPA